jgi:hypothetical protein
MKATILVVAALVLILAVPFAVLADGKGHQGHGNAWGHFYSHGARWGLNGHVVWNGNASHGNPGRGHTGGSSGGTGDGSGGTGDGKGDPGQAGNPTGK